MATLYDQLKAVNQVMADAYQAVVKSKPDGKLDTDGIVALFKAAGAEVKNARHATVETMFLIWENATFTAEGLQNWVPNMVFALIRREGTGKLFMTSTELSPIVNILGVAANVVNFTSPKLGITYNASQYLAMAELVKTRKIRVLNLKAKPPEPGVKAEYDPNLNVIYLYPAPNDRVQEIIHELTHAVQDWNDVSALSKHLETDAFIVQGLVVRHLDGGKLDPSHPFFDAVELVVQGKAVATNPDWISVNAKKPGAYDKAVAHVTANYQDPEVNKDMKSTEKLFAEKAALDAIVNKLSKTPPPKTPTKPGNKPVPAGRR